MVKVTWHPWRCNPLDYLNRTDLIDLEGRSVSIKKEMDFIIIIGDERHTASDNSSACEILDRFDVGISEYCDRQRLSL